VSATDAKPTQERETCPECGGTMLYAFRWTGEPDEDDQMCGNAWHMTRTVPKERDER